MSTWNECTSCDNEFQVIGGGLGDAVEFCPWCGEPIEADEDEIGDDFENDDEE